jgi:hypothetical protein
MSRTRKTTFVIILACSLLFAVARTGILRYWGTLLRPLGEPPRSGPPSGRISHPPAERFLYGDFKILTDVKALPSSVLQVFTERGGSRLLMANPGEKFQTADVVQDASLPRMRLLFAGVSDDKCFVHYEHGGTGHTYNLSLFGMVYSGSMQPLWRGYCDRPAANFQDLRSLLADGMCSPASGSP